MINQKRKKRASSYDPLKNFTIKKEENLLRVISTPRKGAPGLLSNLKIRYLMKKKKQEETIVSDPYRLQQLNNKENSTGIQPIPTLRLNTICDPETPRLENCRLSRGAASARDETQTERKYELKQIDLLGAGLRSRLKKEDPPIHKDTSTTVVAFNSSNLIIQPKYMLNRGSMCVCELWNKKDKQRVAKIFEEKVIDGNKLPISDISKSYMGIFRPHKMEQELKAVKKIKEFKLKMNLEDCAATAALHQIEPSILGRKKLTNTSSCKSQSEKLTQPVKNLNFQQAFYSMYGPETKRRPTIGSIDEDKSRSPTTVCSKYETPLGDDNQRRCSLEKLDRTPVVRTQNEDIQPFLVPELSDIRTGNEITHNTTNSIRLYNDLEKNPNQDGASSGQFQQMLLLPYIQTRQRILKPGTKVLTMQQRSGSFQASNSKEVTQSETLTRRRYPNRMKSVSQRYDSQEIARINSGRNFSEDDTPRAFYGRSQSRTRETNFNSSESFVHQSIEKITDIQEVCRKNSESFITLEKLNF